MKKHRSKIVSLALVAAVGITLMGLAIATSGCVTTSGKTDVNKEVSSYPAKDAGESVRAGKIAEWEALEKTYGPGEVEIFHIGDVKIKRYTYRANSVTYRVLFYNNEIHSIVTDR